MLCEHNQDADFCGQCYRQKVLQMPTAVNINAFTDPDLSGPLDYAIRVARRVPDGLRDILLGQYRPPR